MLAAPSNPTSPVPIGLEPWTVRTDLKRDFMGTLAAVAGLGYQTVEVFSTYLDWTPAYARDVRTRLDDLGMTCSSTHNGMRAFTEEALPSTAATGAPRAATTARSAKATAHGQASSPPQKTSASSRRT